MLGVEHTVIESVELGPDGKGEEVLVDRVPPKAGVASRCSWCQLKYTRRAPLAEWIFCAQRCRVPESLIAHSRVSVITSRCSWRLISDATATA